MSGTPPRGGSAVGVGCRVPVSGTRPGRPPGGERPER